MKSTSSATERLAQRVRSPPSWSATAMASRIVSGSSPFSAQASVERTATAAAEVEAVREKDAGGSGTGDGQIGEGDSLSIHGFFLLAIGAKHCECQCD